VKPLQEVISGKDEGVYQWLSINYVLGKLDGAESAGAGSAGTGSAGTGPRTVGALDMGGASLQIAMEVYPDDLLQSLSVSFL